MSGDVSKDGAEIEEEKQKKPDDIKESWLNPIRAMQAACHGNRGMAIVVFTAIVYKNDAVRWLEPELLKVHPARLSLDNLNEDVLDALMEIAKNSHQLDNK